MQHLIDFVAEQSRRNVTVRPAAQHTAPPAPPTRPNTMRGRFYAKARQFRYDVACEDDPISVIVFEDQLRGRLTQPAPRASAATRRRDTRIVRLAQLRLASASFDAWWSAVRRSHTATVRHFEPRTASHSPACICERSPLCLQVLRASLFNERRAEATLDADTGRTTPAQAEWEVPKWVRDTAAKIEAACPAAIHYPTELATAWYGNDVETSAEKEEQASIESERRLNAASIADDVSARWGEEYESFESQHSFIEALIAERRSQLIRLITAVGGDPRHPATIAWVEARIEAKSGNRLRGYASCIASLRNRIERGLVTAA